MYYGEKFNSISHLVGAALALVGLGALLAVSIPTRDFVTITSFAIFGFTLVLLYTTSTLYHSFQPRRLKQIFQKLDHASIYLLIAGTYTPYLAVSLGDNTGHWMLLIVWSLAICGLLLDVLSPRRIEVLQVSIYLFMGWICVFRFSIMVDSIPLTGMIWLGIGGLAYTVGVIFYVLDGLDKLKHAHGIWHLFVLTGSITHFVSIVGYVR